MSTPAAPQPGGRPPGKDMVWIPGGVFTMGSEAFYPEERPCRQVQVDGFWMDAAPVTNAAFRRFVKATGYITIAERALNPADFPGVDPAVLQPGALVFRNPGRPVDLRDVRRWWAYVPGAAWRCPEGPGSALGGRDRHPVVQIAYPDALAYAAWAGKTLPSEAEWEYAARGELAGATYAWGDEFAPNGRQMANTWQGSFPWQNTCADGYEGTSPAGAFPPNGFGLYDMAGNVWEWTCDEYRIDASAAHRPCCAPQAHSGAQHDLPATARMVIKGGSYLCAPNYCLRYRPPARQGQAIDTATGHIGFRCIIRPVG